MVQRFKSNLDPRLTKALETLDHYIDDVTAPYLDPIVRMFKLEGAEFFSQNNQTTPWAQLAQDYVAGPEIVKMANYSAFDYEAKTLKEFETYQASFETNSTPNATDTQVLTYSLADYLVTTKDNVDAANYYGAK